MKKIKLTATVDLRAKNPETQKSLLGKNSLLSGIYPDERTFEYTIFVNHITCITEKPDSVTEIRLSCGLEMTVKESIEDVEKLIENA